MRPHHARSRRLRYVAIRQQRSLPLGKLQDRVALWAACSSHKLSPHGRSRERNPSVHALCNRMALCGLQPAQCHTLSPWDGMPQARSHDPYQQKRLRRASGTYAYLGIGPRVPRSNPQPHQSQHAPNVCHSRLWDGAQRARIAASGPTMRIVSRMSRHQSSRGLLPARGFLR